MTLNIYLLSILVAWNLVVMLVYGYDKRLAWKKKRRISEKALLLLSLLFGSVGALIGMFFFHHKTRHLKFMLLNPLFLLIHAIGVYFLLYLNPFSMIY